MQASCLRGNEPQRAALAGFCSCGRASRVAADAAGAGRGGVSAWTRLSTELLLASAGGMAGWENGRGVRRGGWDEGCRPLSSGHASTGGGSLSRIQVRRD